MPLNFIEYRERIQSNILISTECSAYQILSSSPISQQSLQPIPVLPKFRRGRTIATHSSETVTRDARVPDISGTRFRLRIVSKFASASPTNGWFRKLPMRCSHAFLRCRRRRLSCSDAALSPPALGWMISRIYSAVTSRDHPLYHARVTEHTLKIS